MDTDYSNTISLSINGNELIFKLEFNNSNQVYINNFSFENLKQINKYFKQFDWLNECKEKLERFINRHKYSIKKINNMINLNINYDEDEDPIKIEQDTSNNIEFNSLSNKMKELINNNELILGIDLGTTSSSTAIIIDKKLIVIPNEFGLLSTPSYISIIDDEKRYIGDLAKLSASFDKNIIYSSKRLLGRKYNDKEINEIKNDLPFKIKKDQNSEKIKIEINYKKNNQEIIKEYYPEQISAMLLNKLKIDSEYYLSKKIGKEIKIKKAVITVPAYFNQEQRESTKQAAEIINLEVVRMINEPTSASLAYGYEKEENEKGNYIIVIDFGGGTLDITLLNFIKNNKGIYCDIKSSYGDTHFGGDDFDYILMKKCLNDSSFEKNLPHNIRLKRACEKAKIKLSSFNKSKIILEEYQPSKNINIEITRNEFEGLSKHLFDKFKQKLEDFLEKSNFNNRKNEISKIILIGGSTLIPKIKQIIQEFFPYSELNNTINPQLAVAMGASIQGAILSGLTYEKNINLLDVTNLSLGTEVLGEKMSVIIKRSTPFPCEGEEEYVTVKDNQSRINIGIYEGESDNIKDNWLLGNFIIENLPKKRAGEAKIKVQFNIDYNSSLEVKAFDLSNENNKKELSVKKPKGLRDIMDQLKNNENKMKDIENPDYINYKDKIIELQEKINKSNNEKQNLKDLIKEFEKFILNAKNTCSEEKMYISYVKYFFQKINILIKISNNSFEEELISNIKNDIDIIFEDIQFYDSNILNEIIEDFIDNEILYEYCLNKLLINYYEKAESYYFSANQLIKDNKTNEALDFLNKSIEYINIAKQKYETIKDKTIILTSYQNSIKDYELKIKVKKLLFQSKTPIHSSNINIQDLIDEYSKCYLIESEDYKELVTIAKVKVTQFQEADNFDKQLRGYDRYLQDLLRKKKENKSLDFYPIIDCLIYILNSYPSEAYIQNKHDILVEIKNANKIASMYSIILELIGEYQKSLNNLSNTQTDDDNNQFYQLIYNKILRFLNEIKTILDN